jgi:hypothetical protein
LSVVETVFTIRATSSHSDINSWSNMSLDPAYVLPRARTWTQSPLVGHHRGASAQADPPKDLARVGRLMIDRMRMRW